MQSSNLRSRANTPLRRTQEDKLARESDVTVSSTNVTPYREYRGFFTYILSWLVLTLVMIWALVPNSILEYCGVYYYPSKYWAQAIPAYLLLAMLYAYIFIACWNTEVKTLALDDLRVITDEHAVIPENPEDYVWKAPSGVWDLPLGLVNEVLYDD
ncbi:CIC11C00000004481 [Sungouiella intermedia]|uniref:CIC11C00000004481 n=1 Tax=Sungouiella intermedia TaxID=45354 RepID=A0A1L0B9A8_9ASCO|nr:CIC11C00000004481 [[Candida] intermedia]